MCEDDCLVCPSQNVIGINLFILDEDCNIEKGPPGPPGPTGLPGEVGQKGEAVIPPFVHCSFSFLQIGSKFFFFFYSFRR